MIDKKTIVISGAIALISACVGFGGGVMYQQRNTAQNFFGNNDGRIGMMRRDFTGDKNFGDGTGSRTGGQRLGGNGMMGFRPVVGSIISKDDKSITVQLNDGSSKIILVPSTASINTATKVDAVTIKVGDTVRVFGSVNADGSVTAQDVQLNPIVSNTNTPNTESTE